MKTLEMLITANSDGAKYVKDGLYYSKAKGFVDVDDKPWKSYAFDTLNDLIHDDGHYAEGWKKVITLTETERVILRSLKGEWLARDLNGDLYCYNAQPIKDDCNVWDSPNHMFTSLEALSHLFSMIRNDDTAPTAIKELLGYSKEKGAQI
jgi:hypothetical protein